MGTRRDTLLAGQYFTAVAGMAAMRGCLTHPSSVRARLDDIRSVVEHLDEFPNNLEIPVIEHDVDSGYTAWAPRYDGPNPAIAAETPIVHAIVERAPRGRALDAACGTGRHLAHLHGLGYDVIGVDANQAMLDVARGKVAGADVRLGTLQALPVDDASIDLLTCSLALTHVDDLGPVLVEMARVVRPGGWVVLADIHPVMATFGGAAIFPSDSDGLELPYVPNLVHQVSDYVTAVLAAGLRIDACLEPVASEDVIVANPAYPVVGDAVRQAFTGLPYLLVWRLSKPS